MPKRKEEKKEKETEKKTEKRKLSEKDFEDRVLTMAEKGMTSEKIGEALRREGIHPMEHGKISRILKKRGAYVIPDVKNAEEKLARIEAHRGKNMQDKRAMRERERIFSLLRKQKGYHKTA